MLRFLGSTLACTLLLAPLGAADILTVGPDAGAYDFTTIQAAVDAAVSGDTVQIAPGIYDGFQMLSKSVSVIGAGADETVLRAAAADLGGELLQWLPTAAVWDVQGDPIAIGGFRIAALEPGLYLGSYGLNIDRTVVPIHLFDIEVVVDRPLLTRKYQRDALFFQNLVFDSVYSNCRTTIVPGWEPWAIENPGDYKGVSGCTIFEGEVWMSNCRFEGLPGPDCGDDEPDGLFGDFSLSAGPGVLVESGRLTLAGCQLIGADGAVGAGPCVSTAGAPGLWRRAGQFGDFDTRVHGGVGNLIAGGSAVIEAAPAIQLDAPDDVTFGSGVQLQPGVDQSGTPAAEWISTSSAQGVAVADRFPSLSFNQALVPLGGSTQLRLSGDRFAVAFVRWSPGSAEPYFLPNIAGTGFLVVDSSESLPNVLLDAQGQGALSIQVPLEIALLDNWYTFQMAEYDGDLEFAPPVVLGLQP
jgi:hypothetical protein